jgi:hypothetical protein
VSYINGTGFHYLFIGVAPERFSNISVERKNDQNPLSVKWNLIMVAMQDLQTVEIGDTPSFRQILAARINRLQTRETLSLELQALLFLSMNRREAFAWLKARNCYVRFVQKKRVIELRKM